MKIGVMLRSFDENQGIGIYTRYIVPSLLKHDGENEYLLIYRSRANLGKFSSRPNVTETVLELPTKAAWDQVGVPWLARRHGVDLIFNTKFTVPLLTKRPSVMFLHGSAWFTRPELFHPLDIAYVKAFMGRYCRKASHLISNSELTTEDFVRYLGVPRSKITTLHYGLDERFHPVADPGRLEEVRKKYGLPDHFLVTVTKYFPGKNVPRLLRAFGSLPPGERKALVLVGRGVDRYLDDLGLRGTPLAREILTPGWVDQGDLPAIYSMAEAFVFPSLYEEFGIPIVEAMACGCPVVGSNTGAMLEVSGGAAELVNPESEEELAAAIRKVLNDPELHRDLRERGFRRARDFSWDDHALRTLEIFRRCVSGKGAE